MPDRRRRDWDIISKLMEIFTVTDKDGENYKGEVI